MNPEPQSELPDEGRIPTQELSPTEVLVRRVQETPERWGDLHDHLATWLRRRAESLTVPPSIAIDDLTQEVLIAVYRGLPAFELNQGGTFKGWLKTLIDNRCRDMWRRHVALQRGGGRVKRLETSLGASLEDSQVRSQQLTCELRDERELFEAALPLLKDEHREALELSILRGLTSEEIAPLVGLSNGNSVRGRLMRARKALQAAIDTVRQQRLG